MSVNLGLSAADMLFVRCESELPCIRAVCDALKQARAAKSQEIILWATAVARP